MFSLVFNSAMFVCFSIQPCNVCWYHHRSTKYICCFSIQLCNVSLLLSYSMMHDWLLSLFYYAMLDCLIFNSAICSFYSSTKHCFVCFSVQLGKVCLSHCSALQGLFVSLFNYAMFVCIIIQPLKDCLSHCSTMQGLLVSLFNSARFDCLVVQPTAIS